MRLAEVQKDRDRSDRDLLCHERIGDDLPAAELLSPCTCQSTSASRGVAGSLVMCIGNAQ